MKKLLKKIGLAIIGLSIVILFDNCGGGGGETSTNEYLGKLPGIAKKYKEKIDNLEKKEKETYNTDKSWRLHNKIKELSSKARKAIEEYLASNPITNIPFEQEADYQFKINKVWVEKASAREISFKSKVTITEDIIEDWGGPKNFTRNIFAYMKAVDKEGNSLTGYGVAGNYGRGPFKANMEVEMNGVLYGPAYMANFEKLVFVSNEEYENNK